LKKRERERKSRAAEALKRDARKVQERIPSTLPQESLQRPVPSPAQPTERKNRWTQRVVLAKLWDGVVVTSVLLGLLLNIAQLHFNIAVDPSATFDPKLISQQGFTVANNGPLALYHVHYSCRFTVTMPKRAVLQPVDLPMSSEVARLPVGGHDTIHCTDAVTLAANEAAVLQVDVVFRPPFWPFRVTDTRSFGFAHDKNGDIKVLYLNRASKPVPFVFDGTVSN